VLDLARDPKGWEGVGTGYFRRRSVAFRGFSKIEAGIGTVL